MGTDSSIAPPQISDYFNERLMAARHLRKVAVKSKGLDYCPNIFLFAKEGL